MDNAVFGYQQATLTATLVEGGLYSRIKAVVSDDVTAAHLKIALFDPEPIVRFCALEHCRSTQEHWVIGMKDSNEMVGKKALEIIQIRKGEF